MTQRSWRDLWTLLNTDVRELGLLSWESADWMIEGTTSLIELGGIVSENQKFLPQIASILEVAEPLIGVLDSPMSEVVGGLLPFGSIGLGILKACLKGIQNEPSLAECVAIVGQAAYLQSLQNILSHLENDVLIQQVGCIKLKTLMAAQSRALEHIHLDNRAAQEVVNCFHNSELAKVFRAALLEQLAESDGAELFVERVNRNTHWYLYQALADAGDVVKPLAELFRNGGDQKLEQERSIRRYLETEIAGQPQKQVFNEETNGKKLSFAEIYVSMRVKRVDSGGSSTNTEEIDLEQWVTDRLNNTDEHSQVMFVQGEPGHGKSVFCRMYADWIRRHLYPNWIPILVRLRDVELQPQLGETLRQAVKCDFAVKDDGWLTDTNTRFLFLLDGFDELVLSQREGQGLKEFLDNVARFQRDCAKYPEEQGHRVLVTGRPMALQGYEYSLPNNLNRVEIQSMKNDLQEQWMANWQAYAGEENTQKLRDLIRNEQCPSELQNLAREPLLLYLLAVLARSGSLNADVFDEKKGIAVKIEIYRSLVAFVLKEQRTDVETGDNVTEKLTGLRPEQLRRLLGELALCITQTGKEHATVDSLKKRMSDKSEQAIDHFAQANILASFYLKKETNTGSIEFIHKSFREFLTAERLQRGLERWTTVTSDEYGESESTVSDSQLHWEIYDLFGYGSLTEEILDYLMGLLQLRTDFAWGILAQRLQKFYYRWTDGHFIDQTTETLPQKKAAQLQKEGINTLGQRQVDIYTGLSVMLLLLELHRYGQALENHLSDLKAQMSFHAGSNTADDRDNSRLVRLIGYCACLPQYPFRESIGKHLNGADLRSADLRDVNLSRADLRDADLRDANLSYANLIHANLIHANLSDANLRHADLSGANLRHADLSGANLSGANLSYADLSGANLRHADLSGANLRGANLSDANLSGANLSGANLSASRLNQVNLDSIRWTAKTLWKNALYLDAALSIPQGLIDHIPFAAAVSLSQGYTLAKKGEIEAALQAYEKAEQLNSNLWVEVWYWQLLCWYGCLYGYAEKVLFAGEKAVEMLENEAETCCLESRGIARALTNNLAGALEDFKAANVASMWFTVIDREINRSALKTHQQRERWISILEAGENPFTSEELAALREEINGDRLVQVHD